MYEPEWADPSIIHAGGDFFEGVGLTVKGDDKLVDAFFKLRPVRALHSIALLGISGIVGMAGTAEATNLATNLLEKLVGNTLPSFSGFIVLASIVGAFASPMFFGNMLANTHLAEAGRKARFARKYSR